jgi:hypothetical protein
MAGNVFGLFVWSVFSACQQAGEHKTVNLPQKLNRSNALEFKHVKPPDAKQLLPDGLLSVFRITFIVIALVLWKFDNTFCLMHLCRPPLLHKQHCEFVCLVVRYFQQLLFVQIQNPYEQRCQN